VVLTFAIKTTTCDLIFAPHPGQVHEYATWIVSDVDADGKFIVY